MCMCVGGKVSWRMWMCVRGKVQQTFWPFWIWNVTKKNSSFIVEKQKWKQGQNWEIKIIKHKIHFYHLCYKAYQRLIIPSISSWDKELKWIQKSRKIYSSNPLFLNCSAKLSPKYLTFELEVKSKFKEMEGNAALSNDEIKRIMDLYTFLWHKWTLSIGQVGGRMRGGGEIFPKGKFSRNF